MVHFTWSLPCVHFVSGCEQKYNMETLPVRVLQSDPFLPPLPNRSLTEASSGYRPAFNYQKNGKSPSAVGHFKSRYTHTNMSNRRYSLSLCQKLSFGTGHILNDLCASVWFSYLLVYLQFVLEVSQMLQNRVTWNTPRLPSRPRSVPRDPGLFYFKLVRNSKY